MVAIFTGLGAGAERGSGNVLGGAGLLGSASLGRSTEQVLLNAATGNLMIQQKDEMLVGLGPDATVARTYNSLGDLSDENGDNWRQSTDRRVYGLTGGQNATNSTVKRVSADGSEITYAWDSNKSAYVAKDGSGAYDTLTWNAAGTGSWTWTDGSSQLTETYGQASGSQWLITKQTDTSGMALTFSYVSGTSHLDKVTITDQTNSGAQYLQYSWSGNNITQITTSYQDYVANSAKTLTRTRYTYDGSNRLSTVTVDLSPEDNSIADGKVYTTTYTYVGATKMVSTITETDGSSLTIGYDGSNRVHTLTQAVATGVSRVTTIDYYSGYSTVTDATGQMTRLDYDASDNLTKITAPPASAGLPAQVTKFTYDVDGNVTSVTDPLGGTTTYATFVNGQATVITDPLGNVTTRTFGPKNELLTETVKGVDQSTDTVTTTAQDHTTHYVYDNNDRLAFEVSPDGNVVEHRYDGVGRETMTLTYTGVTANLTDWSFSGLTSWVNDNQAGAASNPTAVDERQYSYDARGNLTNIVNYGKSTSPGNPSTANGYSTTAYVYDQAGQLLSRKDYLHNAETFVYDGLGRVVASVDLQGSTTSVLFDDAHAKTIVTLANGLSQTSTYNKAGELVSNTQSAAPIGGANLKPDITNASQWAPARLNPSPATIDGASATQFMVSSTNGGLTTGPIAVNAGDTLTWEITLMGVPGSLTDSFGLYGNGGLGNQASGWGDGTQTTATILSGPGTITVQNASGPSQVAGLSTSTGTRVRITRTFLSAENVYGFFYVKAPNTGTTSDGVILASPNIVKTTAADPQVTVATSTYAYDQLGRLRVTTDATGNKSYLEYDAVGRKIADIDQAGNVIEYKYDADNRLIATVRYANRLDPTQLSALQSAPTTFDFASNRPADSSDALWTFNVYDRDGRTIETVDGAGDATAYSYDASGKLTGTTAYASKLSPAQITNLKAMVSGTNLVPDLSDASQWTLNAVNVGSAGTINNAPATQYTDKTTGVGGWVGTASYIAVTAGDTLTFEITIEGVAAGTGVNQTLSDVFGFYGVSSHWGDTANMTATVASGPGSLSGTNQNPWTINGLQAGTPTRIRLTRKFDTSENVAAYFYVKTSAGGSSVAGDSVILASPTIYRAPMTAAILPTADSQHDKISRIFYDKSGRVVGALDGEGYLSTITYDAGGFKVAETSYATPVAAADRGLKLSDILNNRASSSDRTTHYVYDNQGLLTFVVDAQNHVTEYVYPSQSLADVIGQSRRSIQYSAAIATPATWTVADVRSAINAVPGLATSSDNRSNWTIYDSNTEKLAYSIDATGAVTGYKYDAMGHVIKTTRYAALRTTTTLPNSGDMDSWVSYYANATNDRTTRNYYDARGDLTYTVDGEGYVTRYDYDGEDRQVGTVRWDVPVGGIDDTKTINDISGLIATAMAAKSPTPTVITTATSYDIDGRVATTTDGEGSITKYDYYANGLLQFVTTAYGTADAVQTYYVYDGAGRVLSRYDAYGSSDATQTQFTYNAFGQLFTTIDPLGNTTTNNYDRDGRLTSVKDAALQTTFYTYDAFGEVVSTQDPRGYKSYTYYDTLGHVIWTRDAESYVTGSTYNQFGELWTVTRYASKATNTADVNTVPAVTADATRDATTSFAYDARGRVKTITDALGQAENYTLNAFGERQTATNAIGAITTYAYDHRGLLKSQVVDSGTGGKAISSSFGYDLMGHQVLATDALNHSSSTVYDRDGRVIQTIDALSNSTFYTYDRRGNLVTVKDALNNVTRRVYDKLDRLIYTIDPLGNVTQNTYDGDGRVIATRAYAAPISLTGLSTAPGAADIQPLISSNDSADEQTRSVYDAIGQLRYTVDPGNFLTEYDYDASGNVIRRVAYTTAITAAATYTLSGIQAQITAMTAPVKAAARITRNVYSAEGKLTYTIDALGGIVAYTHDAFGNTVKEVHLFTPYDGTDDPTDQAMGVWVGNHGSTNDRITRAIYDQDGQLRFAIDAEQFVTQYTYDAVGNQRLTTRYADKFDGHSNLGTTYAAFADGTTLAQALTNVAVTPSAAAAVTEHQYDSAGRLYKTIDAIGTVTLFTLDQLGRAVSTDVANGTQDSSVTTRTFDALGRVTSVTRGAGTADASTTTSRYDALGRLTGTLDGNGSVQLAALGSNPTQAAIDTVYATYGTTYGYDADGNVLTTTVALDVGTSAVTTKTYDAFGNVVKLVDPRNNAGYFYYDALDRLVLQIDPEGYATATSYTASGKIDTVTRYAAKPVGPFTTTTRPTVSPMTGVDTGGDAVSSFIYDKLDHVTDTTQIVDTLSADNILEHFHYNVFGDRDTATSKLGSLTTNTYDKRGLLIGETMQVNTAGATVTNKYAYDARGNKISVIEAYGLPEQRTTTYDYYLTDLVKTKTGDAVPVQNANNIGTTSKPVVESYKYDLRGNLVEVTDANNASSFTYYDHLDRKSAEISAVGTLTTRTFDASGNVKIQKVYATTVALPTTPGGAPPTGSGALRETHLNYDRNNRLTSTVVLGVQYGEYVGGSYVFGTTDITTLTSYDAAGNVVTQTDGRGNVTYTYYNKLGQKTAQVDAENYLTTWDLDHNGNVKTETRYAKQLVGTPTTTTAPTPPTTTGDDRTTTFLYDLAGRRTSESRLNVAASTLDANNQLVTNSVTSTITYKYNGLDQVLQKTEANGDVTKQGYDLLGRLVHTEQPSFADYRGITVTPSTDMTYNGLGEVVQTTVHGDASFASGTTPDRVTLNQYGAGGRLLSTTDATGFATNYFYDNAGNVVAQTYGRLKADGTTESDGVFITYDAAGRETSRKSGVLVSGTWTYGDTTDEYYDAFGEVVARGTNSGGNIANAQEFADYDNAGQVWRTNFNDGVTKAYAYDRSGNATLLLQGNGTANLKNYASLSAIFADSTGAITQTISVFDKRNQLTDTIQPASNNAGANPIHAVQVDTTGSAGTTYYNSSANMVSTGNAVATGAAGQLVTLSPSASAAVGANANIHIDWYGYTSGGSINITWNINLPASAAKGAGNIHVVINGVEYLSNTNVFPDGSITVSSAAPYVQDWNSAAPNYSVDIYQDVPDVGGSFVQLAHTFFEGEYNVTQQATVAVPATLLLKNENANATKIHMFARAAGSNGAYTEFDALPLQNKLGQNVAGWFSYDLTQPPFNGLAANSSWDVKYLAMDAGGNVYDAKQGTMSVDASGSPSVRFDPVAVGGPGQAMLTNGGGHDLLVLSGLPSTAASGRILYRPVGSTGAWSIRALDSSAPFGQQGLKSVDVTGLGGPLEYWVELNDSSGTLLPTKLNGTFTVGGQASDLTQYVDGSRAIQLNPTSSATVTDQRFRYQQNGVWSQWFTHAGGGSWTYDASALADFYSDRSYTFQYETYNNGTLVSQATGTLTLGYDGQSVSNFVNAVGTPAKVVFTPQQASATTLKLYWRDAGTTGSFTPSTITKGGDGAFAWDIDAAGARPASGTRTLEYYYDAYASDGSALPPLNGDDHVRGTLVLAHDSYTNPQNSETRWVIDTKAASQYLIHRSQSYNAFGEISSEVDGKSATTSLYYDTLGKLTKKVSPQVQVMDETGHSTPQTPIETYYYDKSGIIIGKRDANSNLLANGPTTRETVLAGSGHGGDDALTLVQYNADGTHKTFGYDIFGNLRTSTDELNAVTQNKYDGAGRLVEVDHPMRVGGNSPNLQLKDYYGYDGLGERITHTNSVYGSTVIEKTDYDNKGRVTRTVDFGGLATNYTYTWYSIASNQVATAGLANYGGWQTLVTNTAGLTSRENDDIFGNVTWRQDFGAHTTNYTYDLTGHLKQQTGSLGQSITFAYYANGYIASVTDNALHMKSTFEYDSEGNRTLETYNSTDAAPRFYQNAAVTYDALGRVTEFKDAKADITYAYDANGNRREVKSVYNDGVGGGLQTQDYWYKYDSMDRFTLTMGTLSNSVIGLGSNGVSIGYDAAGNRQTATYGYDGHTEVYSYTADGYLENTTIAGVVRAKRTNDEFGRVKVYWQYNASGGNDLSRTMTYDKENRVTDETDVDYTNGSVTTTVHNDYKAYVAGSGYTGLDQGVLTHTQSVQGSVTTQTTYSYDWWDEAKQAKITINATDPSNPNTGQWAAGYSQLTYDVNGHLSKMVDNGGNRVMTYQNDAYGQVLVREETLGTTLGPRQLYYYFDGHRIGDVGNNGPAPSLTDYAQALAVDRNKPASKNGFRTGQPVASADFDENFQPINGSYPDQSIQTYTVRSGDTLQSIAQTVWGDASLWYLIADANGMTASTALVANQTLAIPNKVANFHNNANTFRVYNPGEAIGDTLPTLPPAPQPPAASKGGCGAFGQILMIAIAVAVVAVLHVPVGNLLESVAGSIFGTGGLLGVAGTTIVSGAIAAAAGSVVSQGFGVATGIQQKFSWKSVAIAGIGGAITAGIGEGGLFGKAGFAGSLGIGSKLLQAGLNGAVGSAVSQGIEVATGLQKKFDWAGVAVAGVGAMASSAIHVGGIGGKILSNAVSDIAGAATRSVLEGSDFGDNVLAVLPDFIANTIVGVAADAIAGGGDVAARRRAEPEDTTPVAGNLPPVIISPDDDRPIWQLDPSIADAVQALDVGGDIVVTGTRSASDSASSEPSPPSFFDILFDNLNALDVPSKRPRPAGSVSVENPVNAPYHFDGKIPLTRSDVPGVVEGSIPTAVNRIENGQVVKVADGNGRIIVATNYTDVTDALFTNNFDSDGNYSGRTFYKADGTAIGTWDASAKGYSSPDGRFAAVFADNNDPTPVTVGLSDFALPSLQDLIGSSLSPQYDTIKMMPGQSSYGKPLYTEDHALALAVAEGLKIDKPLDVGGGGDGYLPEWTGNYSAVQNYAQARNDNFFMHMEHDRLNGAVEILNSLHMPIAMLSHSYGAAAAFSETLRARDRGIRINYLFTADPVDGTNAARLPIGPGFLPMPVSPLGQPWSTYSPADGQHVRDNVDKWVDVRATGYEKQEDEADFIATQGGRMSKNVQEQAGNGNYHEVPYHHGQFSDMVRIGGVQADIDRMFGKKNK